MTWMTGNLHRHINTYPPQPFVCSKSCFALRSNEWEKFLQLFKYEGEGEREREREIGKREGGRKKARERETSFFLMCVRMRKKESEKEGCISYFFTWVKIMSVMALSFSKIYLGYLSNFRNNPKVLVLQKNIWGQLRLWFTRKGMHQLITCYWRLVKSLL